MAFALGACGGLGAMLMPFAMNNAFKAFVDCAPPAPSRNLDGAPRRPRCPTRRVCCCLAGHGLGVGAEWGWPPGTWGFRLMPLACARSAVPRREGGRGPREPPAPPGPGNPRGKRGEPQPVRRLVADPAD